MLNKLLKIKKYPKYFEHINYIISSDIIQIVKY